MVYDLYEAKPEPKELWVVPDADHATSYKLNKEAYTEKVKQFTDKYIQWIYVRLPTYTSKS